MRAILNMKNGHSGRRIQIPPYNETTTDYMVLKNKTNYEFPCNFRFDFIIEKVTRNPVGIMKKKNTNLSPNNFLLMKM